MKASIVRTLASLSLCAALAPLTLQAQTQGTIHTTVPFDFTVGSQAFTAGQYEVWQIAPQVIAIRGADGRSSVLAIARKTDPNSAPGQARLTFNQYGDRYFLSHVSDYDHTWQMPTSPVEKELIAKSRPAKPVVLVAGK